MERWSGRIAVVTGASSGIGATVAKDLVKSGMIVIGLARRIERIEQFKNELPKTICENLYGRHCDLAKSEDIVDAFKWIDEKFGRIDVLINNAGIYNITFISTEGNEQLLKDTIDINLWGLILCTKKTIEIMKRSGITDGHFININSILGHRVPMVKGTKMNVYPVTKYGVTAITEILRQEFIYTDMKTKITSISPGMVWTEMSEKEEPKEEVMKWPMLQPEDVSQCILYVLGTPPHVQIHELTIKPLGETL